MFKPYLVVEKSWSPHCYRTDYTYGDGMHEYQHHPEFLSINTHTIQNNISSGETPIMHTFGYEIQISAYALTCKGEGFASPFGGNTFRQAGLRLELFLCMRSHSLYLDVLLKTQYFLCLHCHVAYQQSCWWSYLSTALMLFNSKAVAYISPALCAISPQDIWLLGFGEQLDFNIYAFLLLINFFLFLRFAQSSTKKMLMIFQPFPEYPFFLILYLCSP